MESGGSTRMNEKTILIFSTISILAIFLLRFLTNKQAYQITNTNIEDSQKANPFGPFIFQYNKNFPNNFTDSCQIESSPETLFNIKTNESSFTITPGTKLEDDSDYQLTIVCQQNFQLTFSIHTKIFEEYSLEELLKLQTQLDQDFAAEIESVYIQDPWREKLPIFENEYTVTYSQVDNMYLVTLKLPPNSSPDAEELEKQILKNLEEINAPTLPIYWK